MAPSASAGKQSTNGVVASGKLHNREKHRCNNTRTNRKRNVSPEQKQRIKELYAAGKNGYEIARELGLASTTVYKYLKLGKQSTPAWTDDEIQILVDGYMENRPVSEIAAKVGRSQQAVRIRMCRHRKQVRSEPKKRRVLSAITLALKAIRKADIFREVSE